MPQEEYKILLQKIGFLINTLQSYCKVDATISKDTINNVIKQIDNAQDTLELGFVSDACEEVLDVLRKEENI